MISMFLPAWWKLAAAGAVVVVLAGGVWKVRHGGVVAGRAEVQEKWNTENEALAALARRSLESKIAANQGNDREHQKRKSATSSINLATDYGLQQFKAAAARSGQAAATSCRVNGPAAAAASELATAAAALDAYARNRLDQVIGLQAYVLDVCQTN